MNKNKQHNNMIQLKKWGNQHGNGVTVVPLVPHEPLRRTNSNTLMYMEMRHRTGKKRVSWRNQQTNDRRLLGLANVRIIPIRGSTKRKRDW